MTAVVPGLLQHGRVELLETPQGLRDGRVRVVLIQEETKPAPRLLAFGKYRTGSMSCPESFKDAEWQGQTDG